MWTTAELDAWRERCDPLADAALAELVPDARATHLPFRDLQRAARARAAAEPDGACARFVRSTSRVPDWVEPAEFVAGRRMFERYGVLTMLVGVNVLIESYQGGKDNKVLMMSGRLSDKRAFRRLAETAKFTMDVVAAGGLDEQGPGRRSILSVRLLHARVRQLCRMKGYDVAARDEPINQEAMAGTLMLFSCGIVRALERMGVHITDEEKQSYHALWRYAGWLLGVDEVLLPVTYADEVALWKRIKAHAMAPNADSVTLFEHASRGIAMGARDLPWRIKLCGGALLQSEEFVRQFVGHCVDEDYRDHLGVHPGALWRAGFGAAAMCMSGFTRAMRHVPPMQNLFEESQRRAGRAIVETLLYEDPATFDDPGFADA